MGTIPTVIHVQKYPQIPTSLWLWASCDGYLVEQNFVCIFVCACELYNHLRYSVELVIQNRSYNVELMLLSDVREIKVSAYMGLVTDGLVVRVAVSVTWNVLSWSGGCEFEPR